MSRDAQNVCAITIVGTVLKARDEAEELNKRVEQETGAALLAVSWLQPKQDKHC